MDLRYGTLRKIFEVALLGACLAQGAGGRQPVQEPSLPPAADIRVAPQGSEIGDLLRKWYSKGTAAGNAGDYYDNRDGGHSLLNLEPYPQLQKIEYTETQIKKREHWGMQERILPNVVFGNSSTSASPRQGGSIVRGYYASSRGLGFLFAQYARNNLYIYPEHQDHDPGHNGAGGYGDLFPTNTPCLIASQGSSGSDQSFMRALPYVLAAFQPDVKRKLIQSGLLMPTIQMILRATSRSLAGTKEYLTGKAHPTVFQGSNVDPLAMVEMAHGIHLSDIPPIAIIRVLNEDEPERGVGHFEPELTEKLGTTPVVAARVFRGIESRRKIVVSAEASRDLNNRPLKYHWAVLRGDPAKIRIEYRNPSCSVAEITVSYHNRSPIAKGSPLESNRVDIGVFVHNGAYYSPPAFVTFYTLDNEARTYRGDGRPLEIAYGAGTSSISVADWKAFFGAVNDSSGSWPRQFLKAQFSSGELSALTGIAKEFGKVHSALVEAQKAQERANAPQVKADKTATELQAGQAAAARKAVREAQAAEDKLLEEKVAGLGIGVAELVKNRLNALLEDPDFWSVNAKAIELLCASADRENAEAFRQIRKTLVLFGVAEDRDGSSFQLKVLREGSAPLAARLTRYEKGMIERLNAVVLSRIVFPGILRSEWRENYVDQRITSIKEWRDVYRYAPDGALLGWRRYQPDGVRNFNADGWLVLEEDSQGRCTRARAVRYELEPVPKDLPRGLSSRRVKLAPTEEIREY